jgi:hypothetical protein
MTKRFSRSEIADAAAVAVAQNVSVVLERPDGNRITVTPQTHAAPMDADMIKWGPK